MGRGRRGPVNQSQKKPEIFKYPRDRGGNKWWRFGMLNDDKILLFLPADVVDEMERMNPQEVANILLSKEM